mgnify:CR=1 FL=1
MFSIDFLLKTQVLLKLPKVHAQRTHGRNSWDRLERRRLEADDAEGVLVVDFGCLCVAADAIFIGFPRHLLKTERVESYE